VSQKLIRGNHFADKVVLVRSRHKVILLDFIRVLPVRNTLRGRPRLSIPLDVIIEAVRRTGFALKAASEPGCSDAYIHQRLKSAGLSLYQVLESRDAEDSKKVTNRSINNQRRVSGN
jgi:hypothetical protein